MDLINKKRVGRNCVDIYTIQYLSPKNFGGLPNDKKRKEKEQHETLI